MRSAIGVCLLLAFGGAATGSAVAGDADKGKDIYQVWCSDCHASTGGRFVPPAGFTVLQKRYNGSVPAELSLRTDLQPIFIRTIVRSGLNVMPRTRKTEISDAELDDLVAFLTRNNKQ